MRLVWHFSYFSIIFTGSWGKRNGVSFELVIAISALLFVAVAAHNQIF